MSIGVELVHLRGKEAILKSSHFTASAPWVSVVVGMLGRASLLAVFRKASLSFDLLQVLR